MKISASAAKQSEARSSRCAWATSLVRRPLVSSGNGAAPQSSPRLARRRIKRPAPTKQELVIVPPQNSGYCLMPMWRQRRSRPPSTSTKNWPSALTAPGFPHSVIRHWGDQDRGRTTIAAEGGDRNFSRVGRIAVHVAAPRQQLKIPAARSGMAASFLPPKLKSISAQPRLPMKSAGLSYVGKMIVCMSPTLHGHGALPVWPAAAVSFLLWRYLGASR